MTDAGIMMGPYFRTLHSGFCDRFIDLGKFPVQIVTMQSIGPPDLKDPLDTRVSGRSISPPVSNASSGDIPTINEKVNGTYD